MTSNLLAWDRVGLMFNLAQKAFLVSHMMWSVRTLPLSQDIDTTIKALQELLTTLENQLLSLKQTEENH